MDAVCEPCVQREATMSGVNKELLEDSIREASTLEVLNFLGEVLRVHKIYQLPHTEDEVFMTQCRHAFQQRHAELSEEQNG